MFTNTKKKVLRECHLLPTVNSLKTFFINGMRRMNPTEHFEVYRWTISGIEKSSLNLLILFLQVPEQRFRGSDAGWNVVGRTRPNLGPVSARAIIVARSSYLSMSPRYVDCFRALGVFIVQPKLPELQRVLQANQHLWKPPKLAFSCTGLSALTT